LVDVVLRRRMGPKNGTTSRCPREKVVRRREPTLAPVKSRHAGHTTRNVSTTVRQLFNVLKLVAPLWSGARPRTAGIFSGMARVFNDFIGCMFSVSGETEDGSAGTQPSEG